jgi:Domain of unknown function (DUF4430)
VRCAAGALALLALAGTVGCGLGPGSARGGAISLAVTRDFGEQRLAGAQVRRVRASDTVMRLLESRRRVETAYGGGFVQSIDGLSGDKSAKRDWFYYVNGQEANVGAADYSLSPGDVIQWDYHRWDGTMHIPDIVGAYPEPFVHGYKGKRLPTRIECEDPPGAACRTVEQRLARAGVTAGVATVGSVGGSDTLVVVVAKWSTARSIVALSTLQSGPALSGVFARFDRSGRRFELLDGGGRAVMTAPPGTGLVAATAQSDTSATWLVTGLDDSGVERAADALDAGALRDAFAVALTPSGEVKLPVGG